jgi:gamma-glutamyltranspeptidase/glutathione hydrolase
MMAGMGIVWERWGRLKWAEIVAPSLALLAAGFPYGRVADSIAGMEQVIRRFPATAAHLMPTGRLPRRDDVWHRPDMDKTIERVAAAGWRDFYDGEIGRRIADHIQGSGGILTRADMAAYQPRVTEPYSISYHGAPVSGPILTNGCLTALQILNMLEYVDLPPADTLEYWHLYAEVLKLAWRDRLQYLADPDFVPVPVGRLLSKDYAAGRVESLRQFPQHVDRLAPRAEPEAQHGTLHVSTADAAGNVVSMTISQGGSFGSCVTVPGTGIILGHGMCRLDPRPGRANSIAPRKRPLNNTGCMILQLPDRDVALGLPGGRRILAVSARAAHLIVDRQFSGHQAAVAPRMHVEAREPLQITESAGEQAIAGLRTMGHEVQPVKGIAGVVNCAEVLKTKGTVRAGSNESAAGAG